MMPESPVTQAVFFAAIQAVQDKIDEKHNNQRSFMEGAVQRIEHAMQTHAKEDRDVADRVLTIENDRRSGNERRQDEMQRLVRRNGFVTTAITLGVTAGLFVLRLLWDNFHP